MATIKYEINGKFVDVEVTEAFAAMYAEMEREEIRVERKETRRHQSLDKSIDNGFDIPDSRENPEEAAEKNETAEELNKSLQKLTYMQRLVLNAHAVEGLSFISIASCFGMNKNTIREHYLAAVKKLRKILI